MQALLDAISLNQPQLQTRQALLVLGLQNDFVSPGGSLPITRAGFVDHTKSLVPEFRERHGNVIWVQTLYKEDRPASSSEGDAVIVGGLVDGDESTDDDSDQPRQVTRLTRTQSSRRKALDLLKKVSTPRRRATDDDEELFLVRTPKRNPACMPNTPGAEFAETVQPCIAKKDAVLRTTNYSAFLGTNLLVMLRASLVTELYICGCLTNVSVLATAMDAARHGFQINIVVDCLGYRRRSRHNDALKRMVEFLDATLVTTDTILNPPPPAPHVEVEFDEREENDLDTLESYMGSMRLSEDVNRSSVASHRLSTASRMSYRSIRSNRTANGRSRPVSEAPIVGSPLSDEQFADMLVQGAKTETRIVEEGPRNQMVKSKVRMRRRPNISGKESGKTSRSPSVTSTSREKTVTSKEQRKSPATKLLSSSEESDQADATAGAEIKRDSQHTKTHTPAPSQKLESPTKPRPPPVPEVLSNEEPSDSTSRREQAKRSVSSVSQPVLPNKASVEAKDALPCPEKTSNDPKRETSPQEQKLQQTPDEKKKMQPPEGKNSPNAIRQPPAKATSPSPPRNHVPLPPKSPLRQTRSSKPTPPLPSHANPILGPDKPITPGTSHIVHPFLPSTLTHPTCRTQPLSTSIFTRLYDEIRWQSMFHQTGAVPRLVCCQGAFLADGSMPLYRHPADQVLPLLPFSPFVDLVRRRAEKNVGHPLNHVLCQLYRSGRDFISEHSDKTLDLMPGSSIVGISFGSERKLRLRVKKTAFPDPGNTTDISPQTSKKDKDMEPQRPTYHIPLPHNSLLILSQHTNARWLHGIQPDKRPLAERSDAENVENGMRISLTFRYIGTCLSADSKRIWGRGATGKARSEAQKVINGDPCATEKLVHAFAKENHEVMDEERREEVYGKGSNVLHFQDTVEEGMVLFKGSEKWENEALEMWFKELGVRRTAVGGVVEGGDGNRRYKKPMLRTEEGVVVEGVVPALLFLERWRTGKGQEKGEVGREGMVEMARMFEMVGKVENIARCWMATNSARCEAEATGKDTDDDASVAGTPKASPDSKAASPAPAPGFAPGSTPLLPTPSVSNFDALHDALDTLETTISLRSSHISTSTSTDTDTEVRVLTSQHLSISDCLAYPLISEIRQWEGWDAERWKHVEEWWNALKSKPAGQASPDAEKGDKERKEDVK